MVELIEQDPCQVSELMAVQRGPCVSLFFVAEAEPGPSRRLGQTRLRNLLREAGRRLQEAGTPAQAVDELLEPGQRLVRRRDFWRSAPQGLAVFLSPERARYCHLPIKPTEQAVVDHRFCLLPLVAMLTGDGTYYILALSLNRIRLVEATRYTQREVPLEGIATSLDELQQYEEREQHLQFRTAAQGGESRGAAMLRGFASDSREARRRQDLLQLFQGVDERLGPLIAARRIPIVLAGVEYLLALYREVSTRGVLITEALTGNPDQASAAELRERAWPLAAPFFQDARRRAERECRAGRANRRAASDIATILTAAHAQRVDALFVSSEDHIWGRYHPGEARTELVPAGGYARSEDLLNLAAVRTLEGGGRVYAMSEELSREAGVVLAHFRYALQRA